VKILHIDTNHPSLIEQLASAGFENYEDYSSSKSDIEQKINRYDGIVIRSRFAIDKSFLKKATKLKFIARVGAGLENIDCEYALTKKIELIAAPEGNRNAVGEHALGCYCLYLIILIKQTKKLSKGFGLEKKTGG